MAFELLLPTTASRAHTVVSGPVLPVEMSQSKVADIEALIEGQKFGWFRAWVLFWSCVLMLFEGYDMQAAAHAAPSIIQAWHINKASFGPVFGLGLFGYMIGATLLSNLADRIGRKPVIIGGAFLFGVFTLATAFATSLSALLVLRFIAGIGLGGSIPTVIALAVDYTPSRTHATMISVLFAGYTIGATLGGVIAARLIPRFGWPIVFYVGGIAPILLAAILIPAIPESVSFLALQRNRPDRVTSILAKLRRDQTFDRNTKFVLRNERQDGLPARHLFTEGRATMTLLLWFAFVVSLLGHHLLTSWLPTILVGTGVPLAHALNAGALLQGGGTVGGLIMCRLLDKRGISAIAIAFAAAAPLILLIGVAGRSDVPLMPLVFLSGVASIGGQTGLQGISGTFYPTYIRSTGTGWANGVGRIGSILGPVLGGVLISLGTSSSLLFCYASVPVLCCAGALFLLGKTPEAKARCPRSPSVVMSA